MIKQRNHFFISCQIGFEEMVKQELLHILAAKNLLSDPLNDPLPLNWDLTSAKQQELFTQLSQEYDIQIKVGGVSAKLELYQVYQFILWSRISAHVLLVLNNFYIGNDFDLYQGVYATNWEQLLHPGFEFKVNFNGTNAELKNSQYSALRVKDALVDYYTNHKLERPNVNTEDPDIVIDARLHRDHVQLSLDLTGTMHKRYRSRAGFAPMRETLAANLILRSGWDKKSIVYNPMCGSGVLAIEAALIALNIAPGLFCEQHHLDYWQGHSLELWVTIMRQAKNSRLEKPDFKVYASDNDKAVLIIAQQNSERVGVESVIDFTYSDFNKLSRKENTPTGLVIINPPYGVRLANERELYNTYYAIGHLAKQLFPGWIMGVISSSQKLLDCISLATHKRWNIKNSNLDCQFRTYTIRGGLITNSPARDTETNQTNTANATPEQAETPNISVEASLLDEKVQSLYNRLVKNTKRLNNYLKRNKVQNYRLYDADIPEYNIAVDIYTNQDNQQQYYLVQEYAANKNIPTHKAVKRGLQALAVVQKFATDQAKVYIPQVIDKLRQRQRGDAQYTRIAEQALEFYIEEYGCKFKVNLTDYIDTGIFLDNRDLRFYLRSLVQAKKTRFLNLFSYTATATVHVIKAQAHSTISVDMSNNYCTWSAHHLKINGANPSQHKIIQADVLAWLDTAQDKLANSFDLVFCDPPTFSNSKRMEGTFDVQRDHLELIKKINTLLSSQGKLVFCNNRRGFKLDYDGLAALGLKAQDITQKTMPADFANSKIHQAWLITRGED